MQTDFSFGGQIQTLRGKADECELEVFYQGKLLKKCVFSLDEKYTRFQVRLMENDFVYESLYWTLEHPRLLDVVIRLYSSGVQCDEAETRFGMRKISVNESGVICLNNRPLYQKLILDQGYWPESGLTPPSAESLKRDILLAKKWDLMARANIRNSKTRIFIILPKNWAFWFGVKCRPHIIILPMKYRRFHLNGWRF